MEKQARVKTTPSFGKVIIVVFSYTGNNRQTETDGDKNLGPVAPTQLKFKCHLNPEIIAT